jgi:hypothetical protein
MLANLARPTRAATRRLEHARATAAPRRTLTMAAPAARAARSMDDHSSDGGAKLFAAAADRNKDPILAVLRDWLPSPPGAVLEVAAGTGQHAAHFASALPGWAWQPTEADPACLASIAAHTAGLENVAPPAVLDVASVPPAAWPRPPHADETGWAAVYAANLAHISPWAATAGLLAGAAGSLRRGGRLLLYGPFAVDGAPATPSDAAFDASLRARDPEWGYRDIKEVTAAAEGVGLGHLATVAMPANNFTLVFERR